MLPKVQQALARLVLQPNAVFYSHLLLSTPIKEDTSIGTAATDGCTIWFSTAAVEKWSLREVTGVLVHEAMHIAMKHPWRRGNRDPFKANVAMDEAINSLIKAAGFVLPANHLDTPEYRGKSFEDIYRMLPDQQQQAGSGGSGDDSGSGSGSGGSGDDSGSGSGSGGGSGGSGDDSGPCPIDDVRAAPGSAAERAASEAEVEVRIRQAAAAAAARGVMPGELQALLREALAPVVDWRSALRQYMQVTVKADQSWNRGQRRFLHRGMYLPAMSTPGMGKVSVIMDTSGSVYGRAAEFVDELTAVMTECNPTTLEVIHTDAAVHRVDTYAPGDTVIRCAEGGGGTDLRKGFDYIDTTDEMPEVLVVFTDLETPFPKVAPAYPVLWVATTKHAIPFGDVIRM